MGNDEEMNRTRRQRPPFLIPAGLSTELGARKQEQGEKIWRTSKVPLPPVGTVVLCLRLGI